MQAAPANSNEDKGLEATPEKDEDPDGQKLLSATDGLERAAKQLISITSLVKDNIDVWVTTYDVAIRRSECRIYHSILWLKCTCSISREVLASSQSSKSRTFTELWSSWASYSCCTGEENKWITSLLTTITHIDPRAVSSLPQAPPAPMGPLLSDTLSRFIPDDISLETYNSQYLQKNTSPLAILAAATVSWILGSSREEVENIVFTTLEAPIQLSVKVGLTTHISTWHLTNNVVQSALKIVSFLAEIHSTRLDGFKEACGAKFEMSTMFKTQAELEILRKCAAKGDGGEDSENVEVIIWCWIYRVRTSMKIYPPGDDWLLTCFPGSHFSLILRKPWQSK